MTKVWILVIDHKHGTTSRVFATAELAEKALLEWCKEWWLPEFGGAPMPDDDILVEDYFERMANRWGDGESYVLEECTLETEGEIAA